MPKSGNALVIAASLIAAIRLAKEEKAGSSPNVKSIVASSVNFAWSPAPGPGPGGIFDFIFMGRHERQECGASVIIEDNVPRLPRAREPD